jgi:hypothetical protein
MEQMKIMVMLVEKMILSVQLRLFVEAMVELLVA